MELAYPLRSLVNLELEILIRVTFLGHAPWVAIKG